MLSDARKSAEETKSFLSFLEICNFSSSPKSRTNPFAALRHAFSITKIIGGMIAMRNLLRFFYVS